MGREVIMEKQKTTNNIEEIAINSAPLRTAATLDESSGYPYTVTLDNIVGFSCLNQSGANTVTFTITLDDSTVLTIPILASGSYAGEFEDSIATIAVAGTTPDFVAELMRRIA